MPIYCGILTGSRPPPRRGSGGEPASAPRDGGAARESFARLAALETWLDRQALAFAPEEIHRLLTHVIDETALTCAAVSKEILGPPRPAIAPARQKQSQVQ